MPLVSVVVPNYNHAPYLKERMDSILNQTFQDFEVLVLDDCSTDNSMEVIDQYAGHPKVSQIIRNEINSGSTFIQWTKGIGLAAGEYIWIAESDDWCERTFLDTAMEELLANPNCVLSYCQSYCIVQNNDIKWTSGHPFLKDVVQGKDFVGQYMLYDNAIFNASMAVWRKEMFGKISREFTQYRFCGDWLFWIELASLGEVAVSGRILNYFRKYEGDFSSKAYQSGLNYREEVQILRSIYGRNMISHQQYLQVLKKKFLEYRLTPHTFAASQKAAIEHDFFLHSDEKRVLKAFYNRWKIRHVASTLLTSIFSKPGIRI